MPRRSSITCPACAGVADPVMSGLVEYDRCRFCGGVWLDCGEFEVLLALAHRAGKNKAREPLFGARVAAGA
ncbi:zf-TFIIB domain-containing protein [Sphingomonas lenta]|uniref:Transcription factor zinc-finger domain-containing protein n=1 Tax=Sphingomonas lenta TaxID=1141887 RepID=A0A2A2SCW5_9SPHN|nr:zf-TFIIB domain-containing protein [Sphingomonas lenta]PAX07022.1 hypothetical protein CKY28_13265 [Sphingomonas lenta]